MNASKPTKAAYFDWMSSIELPTEIWDQLTNLSGPDDERIIEARKLPEVIAEFSDIRPEFLVAELQQSGYWQDDELLDHNTNISLMLWLAACNVKDGYFE